MSHDNLYKCGVASIAISAVLVLTAVFGIRYGLFENGVLPRDCTLADAPAAACAFKNTLVQTFLHQRLGWFSLVCGLLAFAGGGRGLAWAGWISGLAGLVLYSYDPAAVGALSSLLVLARPRQQHRQGQTQAG